MISNGCTQQPKKVKCRAYDKVRSLERHYHDVFDKLTRALELWSDEHQQWPDWCYVPIGFAEAVSGRPIESMAPHVRRAHFHHFWRGKEDERELFVRWLPPMPVNIDKGELLISIHPVKS